MNEEYTWIPFYKEMAIALLKFREDRKPLVDWIYSELKDIVNGTGSPLIGYLREEDKSEIKDIDPFSTFAIFNRGSVSFEKRKEFASRFKSFLNLENAVPADFNGIPVVNAQRSFFFRWNDDEHKQIENLWSMYEKALKGEDFAEDYANVVAAGGIKFSITMALFWIAPNKYLALDANSRSLLAKYGIEISEMPDYGSYKKILTEVTAKMNSGEIEFSSFPELSANAWMNMTDSPDPKYTSDTNAKVWMMWKKDDPFAKDRICMGGNVSEKIRDYAQFKIYKKMVAAYQAAKGTTDVSVPNAYWKFINEVKAGDIVVIYENKRVGKENHHLLYGWGRFTSDIINDTSSSEPLQRTVEWNPTRPSSPVEDTMTRNSLFFHGTTDKQAKNIKLLLGITNGKSQNKGEVTDMKDGKYKKYIDILEEAHNLILTGAPGTGKTFMARAIAEEMGAEWEFVQFHPSYDYTDFVEGLRPINNTFERRDGIFKAFCKKAIQNLLDSQKSKEALSKERNIEEKISDFLSNAIENETSYNLKSGNTFCITDFDENKIRINAAGNAKINEVNIRISLITELLSNNVKLDNVHDIRNHFNRSYGTQEDSYAFVICNEIRAVYKEEPLKTVSLVPKKKFVFIIDEINRGELSKIFGELFFSIDPGYRVSIDQLRGKFIKVNTQYQNLVDSDDIFANGFYIPENVYILGTMNDIDRSVESMDFAIRRRFSWIEVTPEDNASMLSILGEYQGQALNKMKLLNRKISETDGLGPAFQIGPSYFLKLKNGDFEALWKMNLEPLLKEYLRGFRDVSAKLETFRKAFSGDISEISSNTQDGDQE